MSRFSLCLVEHKPLHAVPVFARHIGVTPLSQPLSEFELKEIQHRSSFCSTFLPPDTPFFFFFSCYSGISNAFINVSFFCPQETSVSGTFASRSLANTVSGESFWHSASTTSFVTALPVLPARLLLPHPLWPPALHTFVKKGICPRSSCDSLYFWCLFLRAGHLLYVEGRA